MMYFGDEPDAHQTDHIGRTLRQRYCQIRRANGRHVERACQQRGAGIGVANKLDEFQIDAELLEFIGDENHRRKMTDFLITDGQFNRRRKRRRLRPDRSGSATAKIQGRAHCERESHYRFF